MLGELQRGYTQRNAHTKTHPTETAETEVKKKKKLKAAKKKTTHTSGGTIIQMTINFSSEIMDARKKYKTFF